MTEARAEGQRRTGLGTLVAVGLAARFVLELAMLGALAYGGFRAASTVPAKVALAVAGPAIAATIWAMFIAPKASRRLTDPMRLVVELVLFAAAAGALFVADLAGLAVTLGLAYVLDTSLLAALGRRGD